MEKLLDLLKECCPGIDFETETALVDNGILTSLDIVSIVVTLNDTYDISITVDDLEPENFNSAENIYELIQRLLDE